MGALGRHWFNGNRANTGVLVNFHDLARCRTRSWNNHVAEKHGKWFIAHQLSRRQYGMTQSQRFFLPRIAEMKHIADRTDHFGLLGLSLILQKSLELGRIVEMVFDGVLTASRDDDDVFDARSQTLLDYVLNQRLIDHREHLFGLRFGSRQKSGAKTGGRKDGFAHASALLCHNWNPKLIPV